MRQRVPPGVPTHEHLGARHHQAIELADRNRSRGLDRFERKRGDTRERLAVVEELDRDLARRRPTQVLREPGPLFLQRVDRVGGQHRVAPWPIAHQEMRTLGRDVGLRLLEGRAGEGSEAVRFVRPQRIEDRHRPGIVALLEPDPCQQFLDRLGLRGAGRQLLRDSACSRQIPSLELLESGADLLLGSVAGKNGRVGRRRRRPRAPLGWTRRQRAAGPQGKHHQPSPRDFHFTISSSARNEQRERC